MFREEKIADKFIKAASKDADARASLLSQAKAGNFSNEQELRAAFQKTLGCQPAKDQFVYVSDDKAVNKVAMVIGLCQFKNDAGPTTDYGCTLNAVVEAIEEVTGCKFSQIRTNLQAAGCIRKADDSGCLRPTDSVKNILYWLLQVYCAVWEKENEKSISVCTPISDFLEGVSTRLFPNGNVHETELVQHLAYMGERAKNNVKLPSLVLQSLVSSLLSAHCVLKKRSGQLFFQRSFRAPQLQYKTTL